MSNDVEMICPGGKIDKKAMLASLLNNPDLEGITVICLWKDTSITTGWSRMNTGQLAIGLLALQDAVLDECRGGE